SRRHPLGRLGVLDAWLPAREGREDPKGERRPRPRRGVGSDREPAAVLPRAAVGYDLLSCWPDPKSTPRDLAGFDRDPIGLRTWRERPGGHAPSGPRHIVERVRCINGDTLHHHAPAGAG